MTWPCEEASVEQGIGMAWLTGIHRGGADALPLLFEALDERGAMKLSAKSSDGSLGERVRSLEAELRAKEMEVSERVEAARSEAREQADEEARLKEEERRAGEMARVAALLGRFEEQRERYFEAVEGEVVKLALAIAQRVLHREAKLDPLLLLGVVRVALERLAEGSEVTLRVPLAEERKWTEALARQTRHSLTVAGMENMPAGDCRLETNVGRVELGVAAQLEEIAKGFFDLMELRPS